jgi:hypothetical protein
LFANRAGKGSRTRVAMLREHSWLDETLLADILKRHQLEERWKEWTN